MNEKIPFEKRIYINQDYTKKQRDAHKALRDELKERLRKGEQNLFIRKGQIVKGNPNDQKPLKADKKEESEEEEEDDESEESESESEGEGSNPDGEDDEAEDDGADSAYGIFD